jgi:hypothetical protein
MNDAKNIKVVTGEGQETFVPEHIASDDATLKRLLAPFYGTDNFRIERKEENGETVVRVVKMAGAKGRVLAALASCEGGENPAQLLYRELAGLDVSALAADEIPRLNKRVEQALSEGTAQYRRMQAARNRLARARTFPSSLPVPGL